MALRPENDLRERLMRFSLRVLRLCASLPETPEGRLVRNQLIRSGTSPGAQHREASRARSRAEFISKIESAQQELDETAYWLELLERAETTRSPLLQELRSETEELIAIFAASARKAKNSDN
ncbi:MAG: hypothetical protein JWM97_1784 [Phycisphaerales bacterium]|jgi:four helix bundle protein|nr:hypothetical protein [Phycisphaerales bacterium]